MLLFCPTRSRQAASEVFLGEKASYPFSVAVPFTSNRVDDLAMYTAVQEAFTKSKVRTHPCLMTRPL